MQVWAGVWLTAGSNTVVLSDPPAEGGAVSPYALAPFYTIFGQSAQNQGANPMYINHHRQRTLSNSTLYLCWPQAKPTHVWSNRRLKQAEFLLPPALTAGKAEITLQFRNVPSKQHELWPGRPAATTGVWCESDVQVFCYV